MPRARNLCGRVAQINAAAPRKVPCNSKRSTRCCSVDNILEYGYNNNMNRKTLFGATADLPSDTAIRKQRRPVRDLAALLSAALDAPAIMVGDGKRRRVTKRALIAAQLVDRSTQADLRATKLLLDLLQTIAPRALAPEFEPEPRGADDDAVVTGLLGRLGPAE
jgi:hypothetical protein